MQGDTRASVTFTLSALCPFERQPSHDTNIPCPFSSRAPALCTAPVQDQPFLCPVTHPRAALEGGCSCLSICVYSAEVCRLLSSAQTQPHPGLATIPFLINTQCDEYPPGGIAALGRVSRVCWVLFFLPTIPPAQLLILPLSMMQTEVAEPSP